MGTKSLTIIYNEYDNKPICAMYRQMDGYLSGHGAKLKEKFSEYQIINGIGFGDNSDKANGMACFAAQVIAHFKLGIGGIYVSGVKNYQAYNYHLYCKDGKIWVKVMGYDGKGKIFEGWLKDMPTEDKE